MKRIGIVGIIIGSILLLSLVVLFVLPGKENAPATGRVADTNFNEIIIPLVDSDSEVPEVTFIGVTTVPSDLAENQGVLNNIVISFSEKMDPATVNDDTFYIRGPDNEIITGIITSDSTEKIWTFNPTENLEFNTIYDLVITTGAKGISGDALVEDFLWSFTTSYASGGSSSSGGSTDTPTVENVLTKVNLIPKEASIAVGSNQQLTATSLDENDDNIASTITYATSNSTVATVNASGSISALAEGNAIITATATSGEVSVTNTSNITVTPAGECAAVDFGLSDLGGAADFSILAKSGISTTGATSIIGDIGVSPIDSTAITGFGLSMDASNEFSTSSLVTGRVYASDYTEPTPTMLTAAVSDMETAYNTAAGLPDCVTELGAGEIGGMTLSPGTYKWGTGLLISTDVTLEGNSTDVWVFEVAGTLDLANAKSVILSGGALPKNVYWVVGDVTSLGTTSVMNGNILSGAGVGVDEAIVLNTDATLNGRALSQKAVTLDANNVTIAN